MTDTTRVETTDTALYHQQSFGLTGAGQVQRSVSNAVQHDVNLFVRVYQCVTSYMYCILHMQQGGLNSIDRRALSRHCVAIEVV